MDALNIRQTNADITRDVRTTATTVENAATTNTQTNENAVGTNQTGIANNAPQLENIVAVSEDGDTLQVNGQDQNIASTDEGSITLRGNQVDAQGSENALAEQLKASEEKRTQRIADRQEEIAKKEEQADEPITEFTGYTNSQMEQLYLQGRISKSDYDQEMTAREERMQSANEANSQLSTQQARLNGTLTQAQMDAQALTTAFSEDANNNLLSASERIDAMQALQQTQTTQSQTTENEGKRTWEYQLRA